MSGQIAFFVALVIAYAALLWLGIYALFFRGRRGSGRPPALAPRPQDGGRPPMPSRSVATLFCTVPRVFTRPALPDRAAVTRPLRALHQNKWPLAGLILPLPVVILAVSSFGENWQFGPHTNTLLREMKDISWGLRGEELAPPPPLPPALFEFKERPSAAGLDRDWSKLDPQFRQLVLRVFQAMERRGYPLALIEGYRSPERQQQLYDVKEGPPATYAAAWQSRHQYGLAADVAPIRNGIIVISEADPWAMNAYIALGQEAEAIGLTWGGKWTLRDFAHIEYKEKTRATVATSK